MSARLSLCLGPKRVSGADENTEEDIETMSSFESFRSNSRISQVNLSEGRIIIP